MHTFDLIKLDAGQDLSNFLVQKHSAQLYRLEISRDVREGVKVTGFWNFVPL